MNYQITWIDSNCEFVLYPTIVYIYINMNMNIRPHNWPLSDQFTNWQFTIDHFTVIFLVTWFLCGNVAGVDVVLIETCLLFICKSRNVCIKTKSTPASLSLKGQVTKHTTVKWSIDHLLRWLGCSVNRTSASVSQNPRFFWSLCFLNCLSW